MNTVLCRLKDEDRLVLIMDPSDPSADLPQILTANALPIDLPEALAKFVEVKSTSGRLDFENEEAIPLQIDFKAQAALRFFELNLKGGYKPPKIVKEACHHDDYVSILDDRKADYANDQGYKFDVVTKIDPKFRIHSALYQRSTDSFMLSTENSIGNSSYWPYCEPTFNLNLIVNGKQPFNNSYYFSNSGSYFDYNIAQNYVQYWPSMLDTRVRSELMAIVERTLGARGQSVFTKDDFAPICGKS